MKTEHTLKLLEYALGNALRAFSTTRAGGVGSGSYGTFNITHYCGDTPEHVQANRQLLCTELGIADDRLLLPHQTHGDRVLTIDTDFLALPEARRTAEMESVDALVTDIKGVCIGVSTADCVPILLYDPTHQAIAAVHAGWRGTVKKIVARAIATMTEKYGTRPAELRAVVGPSISAAAFEVGDEVYDAFSAAGFPMTNVARRYPAAGGAEKWHIDLWAANVCTLEAAGVELANLMVAGICTYTESDRFFSARRLGINSGRIFNGIMLKN